MIRVHGPGAIGVLMITLHIQSPTMRPMCGVLRQLLSFLLMFNRNVAFQSVKNCSCWRKNMYSSSKAFFHIIMLQSLTAMNAKDIGVLIRLLYVTPGKAKDIFTVLPISKQATCKWTKKREVWPIQGVKCRLGRGLCQRPSSFIHNTFVCLSLVNVHIHSPT